MRNITFNIFFYTFIIYVINLIPVTELYSYPKKFKIAVVQIKEDFGNKESNIDKLYYLTKQSAMFGADLILLPELGTTGYKSKTQFWASSDMIKPHAEPIPGKTTNLFAKIARKYHCYIVIGLVEQGNKPDILYNSLCVINPKGKIETKYRKINMYTDDKRWATKGNLGYRYFDAPFGRFGLVICFDMHFKNPVNYLLDDGVSFILFSSAWDAKKPIANYWQKFAIKHNVFFFASDNAMPGESCIISNTGEVLNLLEEGEEGFIFEEIECKM